MNRVFKWCFVSFSHRQLESFMTQMTRDHHQCYPGKVIQQLVLWTAPTFGNIVEDLVLYHQVTHPIAVHEDPGDEHLSNHVPRTLGKQSDLGFQPLKFDEDFGRFRQLRGDLQRSPTCWDKEWRRLYWNIGIDQKRFCFCILKLLWILWWDLKNCCKVWICS